MAEMPVVMVRVNMLVVCTRCPWASYLVSGVDEPPKEGDQVVCRACGADIIGIPHQITEEDTVAMTALEPEPPTVTEQEAMEAARNGLHLN